MNLPIEFNSSVVKRVNMEWGVFQDAIGEAGFEEVSSAAGGRIKYFENEAGFSITLVNGPRSNLLFPSGPFRGRIFGNSGFSLTSDKSKLDKLAKQVRNSGDSNVSGEGTPRTSNDGSRGRSGTEVTA